MLFFLLCILISLTIFFISFFINFKFFWLQEKMSSFECGFDPFSIVRSPFSLHFFKICLIFIFFDIEIIIIFPLPLIINLNTFFLIYIILIFLIILSGLFFEWNQGSINWN